MTFSRDSRLFTKSSSFKQEFINMRIASKTIYDTVKFNLGNITENLYRANKVVATGKRITGLSDDPVGLTQVLNIKSTLSSIEQLGRNIDLGKSWLIASESALSHVQNMISEARALCVQMATETMGAAQRTSAAETVQNMLEEIISLANTEVNGRYIFAGSETNTTPFTLANNDVTYNGDDNVFTVKIDRDATVQAGSDGEDVFWDETVTIDATNNKIDFVEYSGGTPGSQLTATVQSGTYTHSQLATAIGTAMNDASDEDYVVTYDSTTKKFTIRDDGTTPGFRVDLLWNTGTNAAISIAPDIGFNAVDAIYAPATSDNVVKYAIDASNNIIDFIEVGIAAGELNATITPGDYTGDGLATAIKTAMDLAGVATYTVSYDSTDKEFTIAGAGGGLTQLQLLWNTGANGPGGTGTNAATVLGFSNTANDIGDTTHTSDSAAKIEIRAGVNDKIDFKEQPKGGTLGDELTATISPGYYSATELAAEIQDSMESVSASLNNIDYAVSYDSTTNKITIKENGTELDVLQLLWKTGTNGSDGTDESAAGVLGFSDADDTATFTTTSDNEAKWGIFDTLIDLKGFLDADNVFGISKSITRLSDHFDHFSTKISDIGSKIIRMEIKTNIFQDLNIANTDRLSNIEDADITEAIMDLKEKELAYQAALASSARVMELSLIDYL